MTDEQLISRRTAVSGRVGYSKPVSIRDKGQTRFEVLCQYIPHKTEPDELSVKLMYWKRAQGQVKFGYPAEFTLSQNEAVKLRDVINGGLSVAKQGDEGDYLILKIGEQELVASESDAVSLGRTLATALTDKALLEALKDDEAGRVILGAVQVSARLIELSQAVGDLENALNRGQVDEQYYQRWCDAHSWAFGNAYAMRDEVRLIAIGDQVDVLMKHTANGLRDIFELKRPDKDPLLWDASHKSFYWSSEASRALGQCNRYIDALHSGAQQGLRDYPQIVAYHPRAFIIQGRSNDWPDNKLRALHGLNSRLHGVQIMTYDQMLAQSKQLLSILTSEADSSTSENPSVGVVGPGDTDPAVFSDPWEEPPF